MKEKLPHNRKPSHRWVCGEVWNLRKEHNWEEKKKHRIHTNVYSVMFGIHFILLKQVEIFPID